MEVDELKLKLEAAESRALAAEEMVERAKQEMVSILTGSGGINAEELQSRLEQVTDAYENDLLVFLKCDQPQHHCIGISPGDAGALNHFSVDVGSIDGLMKGIGRMQKAGFTPIWGPGRHGPGGNVFAYFEDPTGFVAEFTCDVLQIDDPESWQARHWPRVPENANVWGTGGPTPRAIALMSGQA